MSIKGQEPIAQATTGGAAPRYPDFYTETALASELMIRLAGKPAGGGPVIPAGSTAGFPTVVVWVEAGSEVLVYLSSVKVKIALGIAAVSIDLECDQTGRQTLIVPLALGSPTDSAGLLAVTDDLPRGNGVLVARWGKAVQAAVWSVLLGLVKDFAAERQLSPIGLSTTGAQLQLHAGEALSVSVGGITG
jgi:hypothetical protein